MPAKLTARSVNNADYQVFTEKSLADVGMPWQSSAIGDGKLCLTAGKPQSGAACGKSAAINLCLEVAQQCSTSSTPIYCVGFLLRRFRFATPAVKHSEAPSALSSQFIYNLRITKSFAMAEVFEFAVFAVVFVGGLPEWLLGVEQLE